MHRHKPDFILLLTVICLVTFGLVMVYTSSMVWAVQVEGAAPAYYLVRQAIFAGIGLLGMFVFLNIPFSYLLKHARSITLGTFLALVLVLIPFIGHKADGGRRWLGPSFLQFQPSEVALIGILIYLAYIYSKNERSLANFKRGVIPPLLILGLQFLLIMLEPDMGTAMLLLLSGLAVMFGAGIRKRHMAAVTAILMPVVLAFAWFKAYRSTRILVFLDPWNKNLADTSAYQLQQSFIAIFHGGLLGTGLGRGIETFLYLPIPQEDFIFAIVVEELGLVGAAFLLGLFALLIWRGIRISQRLRNRFASLLALGISCMIAIGVLINAGAVTGLLPVTGIPLPFVSYGGTALIVNLCAMGILLSLSRFTEDRSLLKQTVPADTEKVRPMQGAPSLSPGRRDSHRRMRGSQLQDR